ncbi:copper resistance CopC family protein [Parafrankia elaeagni]|uniref:copper resistance CopC family protein n=1 Tax=Parafrankia elaeagni TaxID=222534 RepID=UPI000369504F|nr:copper resistance CopC family protein [Parafrankia elaeagni]
MPRTVPPALTAVAALLLGFLVLVTPPRPAWAHSSVLRTEPGNGSTLATPPDRISLVFNEPVWTDYATVAVTGSDGRQVETGQPQVVETTLSVGLPDLATGGYHVTWRVVSADGHPISGEFSFTVAGGADSAATAAPAGQPTPAATATAVTAPSAGPAGAAGSGSPSAPADPAPPKEGEDWWIIGVLIAAVAALGGAVVLIRRKRE